MIRWVVNRPVVAWALALGLLGAGLVAAVRLPLSTRSVIELPRLTVSASWPGASPEVVESWITSPIEGAVQGVRGVIGTNSESGAGSARVTVRLDPEADIPLTRLAVLEQIEALRDYLPPAAQRSVRVSNFIPSDEQQRPLLTYSVTGLYTPGALADTVRQWLVPTLSALPGVGEVVTLGGADNGITISYDPDHLQRMGVSAGALRAAIDQSRLFQSLGIDDDGIQIRPVILRNEPVAIEDITTLPISGPGGRVHTLGELATVRPSENSGGRFHRVNGRTAVSLSINRLPGADAIRTAAQARRIVDSIRPSLPPGIQLRILSDESTDLRSRMDDLLLRGSLAGVAVLLVLLVGLRNPRSALLVLASALVAMAGAALSLYLLKVPANMLTLAGLAMGTGVLVQNGLVVIERLQFAAAGSMARSEATRRIAPAILGATLTTLVVLLPFLYLQGNARAQFVPFAVAFGLALLWSVPAALLIVPALARSGLPLRRWPRLARGHFRVLRLVMRWRLLAQVLTVGSLVGMGWVFMNRIPRTNWGNYGTENYSETIRAYVAFPFGTDPIQVEALVRELEQIALRQPGNPRVTTTGDATSGTIAVAFSPEASLTEAPWVASDALTERAVLIGGTQAVSVTKPQQTPGFYNSSSSGGGGRRIQIYGYSFAGILSIAHSLREQLILSPRVPEEGVQFNFGRENYGSNRTQTTIRLTPDRSALARIGATTGDFLTSVQRELALDGSSQTTLQVGGATYPVMLQSTGAAYRQLSELGDAVLESPGRARVPLRTVSRIDEIQEMGTISRDDQRYVRTLTYEFRGPPRMSDRYHKAFMASIAVPPGYEVTDRYDYGYQDTSDQALGMVFLVGVALVLLSVALIYNSAWAAAMVFLSLPISLGGVVAAFWMTGTAFTREAAVGVILVVGLAVNHAILLIDGAMPSRLRLGHVTPSAIFRATLDRTEMIVLVTLTTIASLIPMSYGTDPRRDLFAAIAIATAGGVLASALGGMYLFAPLLVGWRSMPWQRWRNWRTWRIWRIWRRRRPAASTPSAPSEPPIDPIAD